MAIEPVLKIDLSSQDAAQTPLGELAALLRTDAVRGISSSEAAARLQVSGINEPAPPVGPSWTTVLARQFQSKLILILVAATALSGLLAEWLNTVAIGVTVLISAAFGFLNEYRSERAILARSNPSDPGRSVGVDCPLIV